MTERRCFLRSRISIVCANLTGTNHYRFICRFQALNSVIVYVLRLVIINRTECTKTRLSNRDNVAGKEKKKHPVNVTAY
jgi:hypothetical protein